MLRSDPDFELRMVVDNQTATEVTLMQSGAQRRLMSFKQQV